MKFSLLMIYGCKFLNDRKWVSKFEILPSVLFFPLWISKCQHKNICPFSLCDQVNPSANHETFFNVANSFFADGVYNWGRVGCLFYFAYKMAVKVLRCLSSIHLFNISIHLEFFLQFLKKEMWLSSYNFWQNLIMT